MRIPSAFLVIDGPTAAEARSEASDSIRVDITRERGTALHRVTLVTEDDPFADDVFLGFVALVTRKLGAPETWQAYRSAADAAVSRPFAAGFPTREAAADVLVEDHERELALAEELSRELVGAGKAPF